MYVNAFFAVRGRIVALVTPMLENGQLDLPALRALIDWHIAEGSDALVVAGTTGESPALGIDEYQILMQTSVEQAAGRTPLIASAGRNSTSEAVNWRVTRKKRAQARVCRSCRTTTNRRNTGYSVILRRLPRRWICRSFCITCRGAPWPI